MTVITIDENEIRVSGHANYGEFGHDIVCAALSTLTYSLAEWVQEHAEDAETFNIEMLPGESYIAYVPQDKSQEAWNTARELATIGYEAVASQFPAFATVDYYI